MEPVSEWFEATVGPGALGPRWVVVSERFAPRLSTRHERTFEIGTHESKLGSEAFTNELPNVMTPDWLGEDGLVSVGTLVRAGDLLVGRVAPQHGMLSQEEKLLRSIFGEQGEWRDASLRAPPGLEAEVVASELVPPEADNELQRARVVVAWERPLAIGDALTLENGDVVTVCEIRHIETDLLLDSPAYSVKIAKVQSARDVVHARSIGPYSLVTQQPLGGREQFGGQRLTEVQARALIAGGGHWLVAEMMSCKSDAVPERVRSYESLVKRENPDPYGVDQPPPPPAESDAANPTPMRDIFSFFERPAESRGVAKIEVAQTIKATVTALGFTLDWDAGRVTTRLTSSDAMRARSHGAVRKPETVNYGTMKPEDDGLFCARIFGPTKDYECKCGKYKRMKHRGIVCEECGVEVIQSKVRRERFGHVQLAMPVLHPWLVDQAALLLDMPVEELLLKRGDRVAVDLAALQLDSLRRGTGPRAELAAILLERDLPPSILVLETVPVLPPELRPLVPLDGGRFATSDLNDLYRRVVNRNNRLARLLELNAPEIIIDNEALQLRESVLALFDNDNHTPKPITGPNKNPLASLMGTIRGYCARNFFTKNVDYSGVTTLVVDPSLEHGTCRIPDRMTRELFKPMAYGRMEMEGHVTTIKSAKQAIEQEVDFAVQAIETECHDYPVLLMCGPRIVSRRVRTWSENAIAVDVATARALGDAREVVLHVPLTTQARAECERFINRPETVAAVSEGWFTKLMKSGDGPRGLVAAALEAAVDPLDDGLTRVALGLAPQDGVSG